MEFLRISTVNFADLDPDQDPFGYNDCITMKQKKLLAAFQKSRITTRLPSELPETGIL